MRILDATSTLCTWQQNWWHPGEPKRTALWHKSHRRRGHFDENLPHLPDNKNDNELEEPGDEINPGNTTPTFFEVYFPEVVARRAAIRRDATFARQKQTVARIQHPPLGIDGPTDERVSYKAVLPTYVTNSTDSSTDSHVNNTCNEPARPANKQEPSPQTETNQPTRTTASRYNLRANSSPTRYLENLVPQTNSAKAQLRPGKLRIQATDTTVNGLKHTSENIRFHHKPSDTQDNASKTHRKSFVPMKQLII